jgi:hypothetical protein
MWVIRPSDHHFELNNAALATLFRISRLFRRYHFGKQIG